MVPADNQTINQTILQAQQCQHFNLRSH